MKNIRRFAHILLLISACIGLLASCEEKHTDDGQATQTTDTTARTPEYSVDENGNILFCGYPAELTDHAVVDRNVLYATERGSSSALIDLGDRTDYELSFTVTMTTFSSGSVDLFYNAETRTYYSFSLNAKESRAVLRKIRAGISGGRDYGDCAISLDAPIRVRITCHDGYFRIGIADAEGNFPFDTYDMMYERTTDQFRFVCDSENVRFSELAVRDLCAPVIENGYCNPVTVGADPYILCEDGVYYLYATNAPMEGYRVQTSTDLVNWEDRGLCLKTEDAYGEPTWSAGFWAPEVYFMGDRYVMTYTVNEQIGVAVSDSPLGPFVSPVDHFLVEHKAIDSTIFSDDDGNTYLYYVGFGDVDYGIYGCSLNTETWETGEEHFLFTAQPTDWDGQDGRVSEGPCMVKHNGTYYLTYSGNGYTSHQYAVGYAVSSAPLGKYLKYENNPILSQTPENEAYGTGHHAFFVAPNGERYIVYHRHKNADEVHDRTTCIDRVFFLTVPGEEIDRLVVAGPTSTPQSF